MTIREPASSKGRELKQTGNSHGDKPTYMPLLSNEVYQLHRASNTCAFGLYTFSCLLRKCRYSRLHTGAGSSRSDFDCYWCSIASEHKFRVLLLHQNGFTLVFFHPKQAKITKLQQSQSHAENVLLQKLQGQYERMNQ